jgi:YidC/Oxa1 family membrane protein insertase
MPCLGDFVRMITKIMTAVFEFFYGITRNYGVAIVLLTLAIKLVLVPLSIKQIKVTEQMKLLQPELEDLKRKYKSKPEVYQQRMMDLYKEHKVNPLSGCLPSLLPMLLLWPLFQMLRSYSFPEGHASFLWLSAMNLPDPLFILPILAGISTYFQMILGNVDESQKMMVFFMPVFITLISFNFPAGIGIYWVISNIFMIVQQLWIKKRMAVAKEASNND